MENRLTYDINRLTKNTIFHAYWDNFLSNEEIDQIVEYCEKSECEDGRIGRIADPLAIKSDNKKSFDGIVDKSVRKSKISFHNVNDENRWIFNKMLEIVERINYDFFQYDLTGFDYLQYTRYDESGSNYDYHMDYTDVNTSLVRKLSFSLVLSDPSEYEGCQFQFKISAAEPVDDTNSFIIQPKGRIIAFPSWILHRVTPLKSGVRKALVFWVLGPKFK